MKAFLKKFSEHNAIESLARTDDMLALIGIILLLSIIVEGYGGFWRGVKAKKEYEHLCETDKHKKKKNHLQIFLVAGFLALVAITFVYLYIIGKKKQIAKVG